MGTFDFFENKDIDYSDPDNPREIQTLQKPIIPINPFDVERAKLSFSVYESKIDDWSKAIARADLKSEAEANEIADLIGSAKSLTKDLEARRKDITKEAYDFYKTVLGFERHYSNMIAEKVIEPGQSKFDSFFAQLAIERRKKEREAQEAAAKKQAELDARAEAAGVEKVEIQQPIFKEQRPRVEGMAATVTATEKWNYRVKKFDSIPMEFLTIDDKKIRQAIKNGERNIPGLEIYSEQKAQIRSRR